MRAEFDRTAGEIINDNPESWMDPERAASWVKSHPNTITKEYRKVMLDPQKLVKLPGKEGEHLGEALAQRQSDIAALTDSMKKEGWNSPYGIAVSVYPDGKAVIYEGNRRVRAAVNAGLPEIPVEFRYHGGAENRVNIHPLDFAKPRK